MARRPYAWAGLPDGTPLDAAARTVYREAVKRARSTRRIFTEAGAGDFLAYLRAPAERGGDRGSNPISGGAYGRSRRDLQEAFPDLDGADGGRLVAWAQLRRKRCPQLSFRPQRDPRTAGSQCRRVLRGRDGRRRARPPARGSAADTGDPGGDDHTAPRGRPRGRRLAGRSETATAALPATSICCA